jgi:hypothetical protein
VDKCPVPVCARIKKNLRDQRNQRNVKAHRFMQQRMASMSSAAAAAAATATATATTTNSQVGVASPAPPNTSPGNPTSIHSPSTKAKGSPATHPSNPTSNKPYMNVPSPATGPQSVGKGGPRTPTGKANAAMMASSPAVHTHMTPAPAKSDPLQNLTTDGELTIRRVGTVSPNDMRRPGPNQMMMAGHHGMTHAHMSPMYAHVPGQGGVSQIQATANPMMQRVPSQAFPPAHHQQMMPIQVQQQHQFSAQQYPNPAAMQQGRMMGPGGGSPFPPSQRSQLERILTSPQHHPQFARTYLPGAAEASHHPQQYNQQSNYMAQVGGPHPSLGPPPQYPVNRVQPTAAGYSQMGPGGPRPGGMGGQMGGQMGTGGYMYNANNNNNNSNSNSSNFVNPGEVGGFSSLPPQDKLSRFVEHL